MTLRDVVAWLDEATIRLGEAKAPVLPVQIPEWVEAIPFSDIWAGDDAVRKYTATWRWPTVSNDVRAQLHLRMDVGRTLCRVLPDAEAFPNAKEDVLEQILIDFWHEEGIRANRIKYWGKERASNSR
jgi:hypothetical protein